MCSHPACAVCVVWESRVDFKYSTLLWTHSLISMAFSALGWKCPYSFRHLSCLIFSGEVGNHLLWNMLKELSKLVGESTESRRTQIPWLLGAYWKTVDESDCSRSIPDSFMVWEHHHGWLKLCSSFVMNLPRKNSHVFTLRSLLYNQMVFVCEVQYLWGP